ncbi:hypothetical protein [Bacillus sp. KH172YL63]|uniref:hypothetical protein n=1 Tax=Bacillus sp. KH172YL63 TaxID=2709784 RepID=UPI0013E4D531|nr:hypothetical protein [Bacillus sp. KH172YL63]BCB02631.1 hypothetical protein KH172YL63_07640 [Bacillus sp. KH172YL63]
MNKMGLLKSLNLANRGNLFSIDIPKASKEEGVEIETMAQELVDDGKIKIRECTQKESSVYLHGIIKYARK